MQVVEMQPSCWVSNQHSLVNKHRRADGERRGVRPAKVHTENSRVSDAEREKDRRGGELSRRVERGRSLRPDWLDAWARLGEVSAAGWLILNILLFEFLGLFPCSGDRKLAAAFRFCRRSPTHFELSVLDFHPTLNASSYHCIRCRHIGLESPGLCRPLCLHHKDPWGSKHRPLYPVILSPEGFNLVPQALCSKAVTDNWQQVGATIAPLSLVIVTVATVGEGTHSHRWEEDQILDRQQQDPSLSAKSYSAP
ncbi:unnamed protein product [Pleuronectes platessa]|uniref:Uncharacterized protein n=1 Tax=Pleuronectes platessa TaxID=8262 RepID=A0A9N7YYR5_PLEPL|nr:unnamed protein product [Pleuronectes platessa]